MDLDVVRRAPLFSALDEASARELLSLMTPLHMERGDVLFREGDEGDQLYVITEGKIKLGRSSIDGRENLISVLGPGELLGELSLFDRGPRTATATAIAEAQLVALGHEQLHGLITASPRVAMTLMSALATRLRRTNESRADLVFTDVPGRVAKALLELSQRFGRPPRAASSSRTT